MVVSRPVVARPTRTSPSLDVRVRAALAGARTAAFLSRHLRGGSGMVIGGRVLLGGAPEATRVLSRHRRITLVSGTNGKTTTTALLVAALTGHQPIGSNRDGANTSTGIAGTLATSSAVRLALEVDEAWLPWALRETGAVSVVLTNLTRDQLSRHHEVGSLAVRWHEALPAASLVIANADDPAVVWSALAAQSQLWVAAGQTWTGDSVVCPRCGGRCHRRGVDWGCSSCRLVRPRPDWWLDGTILTDGDVRVPLDLDLPGRFNLGNAALAVVAAIADDVPVRRAARRLIGVTSVAGRFERRHVGSHELRLMLAKNPAGWLELVALMAPEAHPIILLFNADGVDGRDPSWLYDVSFAPLRGRQILVQGRRATDLLLRLELDGVTARRVPGPLAAALADMPPGRVDVVGNYTAFRSARAELGRA